MKKISITKDHVRFLGRVRQEKDQAFLAWSATGVEFTFEGKKLEVTLLCSDLVEVEAKQPHMVVFVDGVRTMDFNCTRKEMTVTLLDLPATEKKTVRILKASEAVESVCVLAPLAVDDQAILLPTAKKEILVEVIGDSITCGYGVNGTLENTFSTGLEDTTKAYAYLACEELDCDLQIVAMSGHGIISGYTEAADKNTDQLVMPFYKTYGKSYDNFYDGSNPAAFAWDFTKREADLVVINLGTNDTSWCKEIPERGQEFADEYVKMLKELRACNPKAELLCVLGIMYQTLYAYIEKAVETYRKETGDLKISAFPFALQKDEDGIAVDYHPSPLTQKKAGKTFAALIRERYQWKGEK